MLRFGLVILWLAVLPFAAAAPNERVLVVGERARRTEIPYSKDLTASKALIAAGGYADFSDTPIHLVRCGEVTRIDMRAIVQFGQREKDVSLKPWDIIVVGTHLRQLQ